MACRALAVEATCRTVSGSTRRCPTIRVRSRYNGPMAVGERYVQRHARRARLVALAVLAVAPRVQASGAEYVLPENGDNVVGFVTTAIARHEDTMFDIGRSYRVGYEEIISANPGNER